jgi:hypothetical protein
MTLLPSPAVIVSAPEHPLQRCHVVWQGGKIDVHKPTVYFDSHVFSAIDAAYESISRDQPAIAGRQCCSGARQSTPSINCDSCAEVSDSVSPGPRTDPAAARQHQHGETVDAFAHIDVAQRQMHLHAWRK